MRRLKRKGAIKKTSPYEKAIDIQPEREVIFTLDNEPEISFLVVYSDDHAVTAMTLDGKYECIAIPTNDFRKGKYKFKSDGRTYTANITIEEDDE